MGLKLKFGAIRGIVRGVDVLGVVFGQNKTPDLMSGVLWKGYWLYFFMLCIFPLNRFFS